MRWFQALLATVSFAACAAGTLRAAPANGKAEASHAAARPDTLPVARVNVPQALLADTRGEILLVDVRPAGQRALGHIRGDVPLPFDQLDAAHGVLPAMFPKDKKLVFYCSCTAEEVALDAARAVMAAGGTTRVAVLVGGYDGWREGHGAIQVDETWEEVFKVDQPPSGWGKVPVDTMRCRYARDDSVAGRGRASARIACRPDTSARGFAGYVQRMDPSGLLGRAVTLSAMVRTVNVEHGAFLWIGAEDAQGRFMRVTRPDADLLVGTQEWRVSQVTGVIPSDAARVLIGVSLPTSGRLWLDDVRVVAPEGGGLPYLRAVVENPGFEE
jgi:rhodanese-related sulfurtransferase